MIRKPYPLLYGKGGANRTLVLRFWGPSDFQLSLHLMAEEAGLEPTTTESRSVVLPVRLFLYICPSRATFASMGYLRQSAATKWLTVGAADEIRTRDSLLGRQELYQLSYYRI